MARSFLLKDNDGKAGGYLQLCQDSVRCRVSNGVRDAELILYDDQGKAVRFDIAPGGAEQCFSCRGVEFACAAVVREERLLLHTSDAARRMFERTRRRTAVQPGKQAEKQTEIQMQNKQTVEAEKEETVSVRNTPKQETPWPQRRWPPSPCWPTAVYVRGRWQETGQQSNDQEFE